MKLFNKNHLREVEESYWEHFKFGIWAAGVFLLLFLIGTIHAVFPFLFSRHPDRIFGYFCTKAEARLKKVKEILVKKNIEFY
jgi:hypothetical protein